MTITESPELDLLSREFTQDPYAVLARLRSEAPAVKLTVKTLATAVHAWVITGYDDGRRLLADSRLSKNAPELAGVISRHAVDPDEEVTENPRSMLFSDPPDHTRLRKLVGKAFTMRRVQALRPAVEKIVDQALDRLPAGEEFDFVEQFALPVPMAVIGSLLGIPEDAYDDFREWSTALGSVETSMDDKRAAITAAYGYVRELIAAKRVRPGDDMISALIAAEDEGVHLTESEMLSTVFLVMNAGYETTASLLSSMLLALLTRPALREELRAEPQALPAAVEEVLRYESPLNMSTIRFTREPVTVGGVTIPENEIVFVSLCSADRDGTRFEAPDAIRLDRPDNGHLAFGHGIHHCLGAPLARLEGLVVLERLLHRFSSWELCVPAESLQWRHSLQFRGLESLPVRLAEAAGS
ncbi:cytochrome P450 [Streptomyces bauhiniae]|uniref:cytochrome P450 family protein n=1 Tax=Streptomyces bauhiniae TaxID=2340725 RepID=UPI0038272FB0